MIRVLSVTCFLAASIFTPVNSQTEITSPTYHVSRPDGTQCQCVGVRNIRKSITSPELPDAHTFYCTKATSAGTVWLVGVPTQRDVSFWEPDEVSYMANMLCLTLESHADAFKTL